LFSLCESIVGDRDRKLSGEARGSHSRKIIIIGMCYLTIICHPSQARAGIVRSFEQRIIYNNMTDKNIDERKQLKYNTSSNKNPSGVYANTCDRYYTNARCVPVGSSSWRTKDTKHKRSYTTETCVCIIQVLQYIV